MLLLALAPAAAPALADEDPVPQSTQAAETAAVRDRLMSSLFFRGELADMIISVGKAGMFVDTTGMQTNAEVRSALITWIQRNPDRAAGIYLHLKTGASNIPTSIQTYEISWNFNPKFMALVKSLNSAAGDKGVSDEALAEAESRLYGGPQAEADAPAVEAGGAGAPKGNAFFGYSDYKLNKAGLGRELAGAGAWLDAAKGPSGRGPAGLEKDYGEAMAAYAAFVVAASSVKGRDVLSEGESRALEAGRAALRARLAALALRVRAAELAEAEGQAAGPGAARLLAALRAARAALEDAAAAAASGRLGLKELAALSVSSEREFAGVYLKYSAYNGLLALKKRSAAPGYSCLYDYVIARYLGAFFPGAAYARARAELAAGGPALDAALVRAGDGDIDGALSGLGDRAAGLDAAAGFTARVSETNRRAQFFLWGLLFRPAELKVYVHGGRPAFSPAFTFFGIMEKK
jgi:hypothetical protein